MMLDPSARTIADLSTALDRLTIAPSAESEIVRWLHAAAPHAARIGAPQPPAAAGAYTRSLLRKTNFFEIVLMHWSSGAATSIHDHGGALCWFAVADGEMSVENFLRFDNGSTTGRARIGRTQGSVLEEGGIDFRADDVQLHRCSTPERPAVSLHVYARALERFHTFDERTGRCEEAASTFDVIL